MNETVKTPWQGSVLMILAFLVGAWHVLMGLSWLGAGIGLEVMAPPPDAQVSATEVETLADVGMIVGGLTLVIAALYLILGVALLRRRRWAVMTILVLSVVAAVLYVVALATPGVIGVTVFGLVASLVVAGLAFTIRNHPAYG